jgi:hypothetical protein
VFKRIIQPDYNLLRPKFWFGQIDSRPFSVFRILFGLLLLKDALYHIPLAHWFYSDAGVTPLSALRDGLERPLRFSLMDSMPYAWMAVAFFAVWAVVLVLLILGYRTKLMTILNFIIVLSVHERNVYVLTGADTVIRVMSFWIMFIPLGHYYSLDAIRKRWARYGRTHNLADLRMSERPRTAFAFPIRVVQLQIALVYVFTGYLKSTGNIWQNGDALFYVFQLHSMVMPPGDWMAALMPSVGLKIFTYLFLVGELGFVFFVFSPIGQPGARLIGLALVTMMHIGIAVTMAIPDFSIVMFFSYLFFFDESWIRWVGKYLRRGKSLSSLPLPAENSPLWFALAATRPTEIAVVQPENESEAAPPEYDSWWIETNDANRLTGQAAWIQLAGYFPASRLWGGLLRFRWVRRLTWGTVKLLVRRDPLTSPERISPEEAYCPPETRFKWLNRVGKLAVIGTLATLFVSVVWWNLDGMADYGKPMSAPMPNTLRTAVWYTGLWQFWDMFAPIPLQWDGWIVIPGKFEDGTEFDLRTGEPLTQDVRRYWFGPMARWTKYDENVSRNSYQPLLSAWAGYYCRYYNDVLRRPNGARLATLEIHFYYRPAHAPGDPENPIKDYQLWRHWCYPQYQY